MKTYTEDEFRAEVDRAVASATSGLQAQLTELKERADAEEVAAKVAAARAEVETRLAEVQKALDEKVLEAQSEREKREEIEAAVAAETERRTREAEIAARRDERLSKVKEVAAFPADYVIANADRWASMDDEAFDTYLSDMKVVASKATGERVPAGTAMTAAREGGGSTNGKVGSAVREVLELRGRGIDPRTL